MHATRWLSVVLALAASALGLSAQDVEMLGRRYGTVPPAGYFQARARDPNAYNFTRGRAAPGRRLEAQRRLAPGGAGGAASLGAPARLGPINDPVTGTFRIPVLLGLFSDAPPSAPFSRSTVQFEYFDHPSLSITAYYDEISRGNVTLTGDTREWVRASMTQSGVTQNQSALVCCGIGTWIKQLLDLQTGVDWGLYDNDGPDGVPNSGDDDGFVDALAVIHPTQGAECGGAGSTSRIWAHKWALSFASGSGPYQTSSVSMAPGGGTILIDDYFVQGVIQCGGTALNEIGVFAHEAGHAFGLPDLYDTRSSGARHNGAGNWDLMATGSWGCAGQTAWRPCHMGAFSKAMLGWVEVTTLPADTDLGTLTLPAVESSGTVYLVQAGDGSNEYFLLENRQSIGFDQGLFAEGLLVWQIDANALETRWPANSVNASSHLAVWLRQADGCDDLARTGSPPMGCDTPGTRGDAGDPFPGVTGKTVFHAGSNPASISYPGTATGLTVLDIAEVGNDVAFRALTRFSNLTLTSTGTSSASGIFTVDGASVPAPPSNVVASAPFSLRTIEAAGGEGVQPGVRQAFMQWTDAPGEPRVRQVVTPIADAEYVAAYGGTQYLLSVGLTGGVNGVAPGTIQTTPSSADLWFAPSTAVQVSAVPQTGFAFQGWSGELTGQPNPSSVVMNGPVTGAANFQLVYNVADVDLSITAAEVQDVQLVALSGTAPIYWSITAGALPTGLVLSNTGRLTGAPLQLGSFPVTVHALDGIGLTASATLTLDVQEPALTVAGLASQFLLSGPPLTALQEQLLDREGNGFGGFDLGDFRAWMLAHPALPLSAALTASETPPAPVRIPMRLHFKGEEP